MFMKLVREVVTILTFFSSAHGKALDGNSLIAFWEEN
jgi:hypothetical protein